MTIPSAIHPAWRFDRPRTVALVILIAALAGVPVCAQYTSPGSVTTTSDIPPKEYFEDNVEDAPWDLGRVRLSPWLGVRDASFVATQNEQSTSREDDFTLTAGAGLRAYLPTGKVFLAAHVLPEYVWWQNDENKRRLNGRYGFGLFGYFNRLTIEAALRRVEAQSFFSAEVQELTSARSDTAKLGLELELTGRLALIGTSERQELSYEEDGNEIFPLLDREEENYRVGLRFLSRGGWLFGLGFEDSSSEFAAGGRNLSNSGTSELIDFGFGGSRFSFRLALALRDLEAEPGSDFGRLDETVGGLEALWESSSKLTVLAYARRRQEYSIDASYAFSFEERQGTKINYNFSKSGLGFFVEAGEDEYETVGTGRRDRIDDVTALGLDFRFQVSELFVLGMQALFTDYDSNIQGFDRDVTSINVNIQLGSLIKKLVLGQAGLDW